MQLWYRSAPWSRSIVALAMFSLLLITPIRVFEHSSKVCSLRSHWTHHPDGVSENLAGQPFSFNTDIHSGVPPYDFDQPATSTAVASPTATAVSPASTALLPSTLPPILPTNTASLLTSADVWTPTATRGPEAPPAILAQPANGAETPELSGPAPTGESVTLTAPLTSATQEVATGPAIVESRIPGSTTYTGQVVAPSGSLLDRLTRNKPGIWGKKAFYVGLGVVYVVLLTLFLGLVFRLARQSD